MKLEQLTFTRFLAAISIVIYHYGKDIYPFNSETLSFLVRQANIGVSYFFILSGFVMIIAYGNSDKINFVSYIQKRFARLYPVYAFAILILALYLMISQKGRIDYGGLLLNLTLTQSWIPGKALSFNSPGWSLSTEMFFYLLFPLLFNFYYKKYSFITTIIHILLFYVLSQFLFHFLLQSSFNEGYPSPSHDILYYFPLMHVNEFFIGNLAGLFFLSKNYMKRNFDLIIISLIVIVFLFLKFPFGVNYHNGLLAFLFVPIIILISLNNGLLTKLFKIKSFVFLGEISYGIYILQVPVFAWGRAILNLKYFDFISNQELIFGICFVALILLSGISYKYIEVPFREKIKNINFKKRY